jgi:UDP-glucose 4-epimerase
LGANGFIGSHLVDALVEQGDTVRAFGRQEEQPAYSESKQVEPLIGDFLNSTDLKTALVGIDVVYHLISTTTPAASDDNPTVDIDTNVRMGVELFKLCVEAGVKRVFFASTGGAIYGENPHPPYSETDATNPVSPYAISKLTLENYLRYFRRKHDLRSVALRISNPYGERQPLHRKQGVIPIFLENIAQDKPLTVLGNGSMVRDYVYVKDVAHMIVKLSHGNPKHEVYNIGSGVGMTVNEIVAMAEQVSGKTANIIHQPAPPTFTHTAVLNTSRFVDEFGALPLTNLEDGMRTTYAYIKKHLNENR